MATLIIPAQGIAVTREGSDVAESESYFLGKLHGLFAGREYTTQGLESALTQIATMVLQGWGPDYHALVSVIPIIPKVS